MFKVHRLNAVLLCSVWFADLSKNRFTEIPPEVCLFAPLESLNLYHNCIKCIPEAIINLQMLTYLDIRWAIAKCVLSVWVLRVYMLIQPVGRKRLFSISDHKQKILTGQTFPYFAETLFPVSGYSLVRVQSCRCNLGQRLIFLHSRNLLSVLPKYLFNLPLKVLLVSNNKLLSIPEEIGKAKDLMELVRKCVTYEDARVFILTPT